jgi:hypothetical protein
VGLWGYEGVVEVRTFSKVGKVVLMFEFVKILCEVFEGVLISFGFFVVREVECEVLCLWSLKVFVFVVLGVLFVTYECYFRNEFYQCVYCGSRLLFREFFCGFVDRV